MNNKITINYNNVCKSKPTTKEEKVRESKNTNSTIIVDPLSFAELMEQGRSFCPAVFNQGKRLNDNWIEQSVFALDFDSGVQPEVIIERCKELDLIPNVVYTSFSDTLELRKFRVVFFFNATIKIKEKAKELQLTLMELFPEVDIACKDFARLFFASKEILLVEEEINDIFKVAKYVLERRERQSTNTLRAMPLQKGEVSGALQTKSSTNLTKEKRKINKLNFSLDRGIKNIQILKDFVEGRWLYHPQLFGLATNLKYVTGGLDYMLKVMNYHNDNGKTQYSDDKFELIHKIAKGNYKSQQLANFSEYPEDHKWKNVFEACL